MSSPSSDLAVLYIKYSSIFLSYCFLYRYILVYDIRSKNSLTTKKNVKFSYKMASFSLYLALFGNGRESAPQDIRELSTMLRYSGSSRVSKLERYQ